MRAIWSTWSFEPGAVAAILLAASWYAAGVRRVWRRAGRGHGVAHWQATCFAGGVAALVVALVSPIDALSDELFAAHMLQHLILVTIAPALLVLGGPQIATVWALPRTLRRAIARWWLHARRMRRAWRFVGTSWIAVVIHAVTLWTWHLPGPYRAALEHPGLHAVEHMTFLGTALLVAWAIVHPRGQRRGGYAIGILCLFATAMQSGALGAMLTFARAPWYGLQESGAARFGLTALEDQQLAGLIMWVPGGLLYIVGAAALFVAWVEGGRGVRALDAVPA